MSKERKNHEVNSGVKERTGTQRLTRELRKTEDVIICQIYKCRTVVCLSGTEMPNKDKNRHNRREPEAETLSTRHWMNNSHSFWPLETPVTYLGGICPFPGPWLDQCSSRLGLPDGSLLSQKPARISTQRLGSSTQSHGFTYPAKLMNRDRNWTIKVS